jgi:iron complex transport system substrate-binding protein
MKNFATRFAVLLLILILPAWARAEPIVVKDLLGREVRLEKPATRIVLGQGRHIQVLSLLTPDPVSLVVGWKEDFKRDKPSFDAYRRKFPAIDAITSVGQANDASFSLETAISLKPDLVLLSLSVSESGDADATHRIVDQLSGAGIPVAFVDFFAHPLTNSQPSLRLIGKLIGRERQAEDFIAFYQSHLGIVQTRLKDATSRPDVFIQVHAAGDDCCNSPGRGVFNDFIEAAGGHNIAADILPGVNGKVSLEYLLQRNPHFYIATGGAHLAARGGLVLGTGATPSVAKDSFSRLLKTNGIAQLSAVREGRAFGIWHLFNDTPAHIVMIEQLAKWLHPDLFDDIDPDTTIAEINARFLAVPMEGTYWIGKD